MNDTEKILDQETTHEESVVEPEAAQPTTVAQELPPVPTVSPQNEANIRQLRDKAERIERERDDAIRRLQELENKLKPTEEDDFSLGLGDTDLAEGKHLVKIQKQMRKQQDELVKAQSQMQSLLVETRLKTEHPDIDKVVTSDNLKTLSELHPELAGVLNSSSDYYSKAKSAYTMIKKLGIHVEDTFAGERELAQRNAAKPRPLASVSPQQGDSPLSRANAFANGLTEDLKKQLFKEMEDAIKNG